MGKRLLKSTLVFMTKDLLFYKMYMMFHYTHFMDHVGSLWVACNRIIIYNRKDHFS